MHGRIHPLTLPKWGLSMTEGTLVAWQVELGARLTPGLVLAEIESTKIVNELAAHEPGVLRRRLIDAGATCDCGTLIGIATEGEVSEAEIDAYIAAFRRDPGSIEEFVPLPLADGPAAANRDGASAAVLPSRGTLIPAGLKLSGEPSPVSATEHAAALAHRWGVDLTRISGTGGRGRVTKADLIAAVTAMGGRVDPEETRSADLGVPPRDPERPATPVARRLAAKLGIALAAVSPRPGAKRIRKADVLAANNRPGQPLAPDPVVATASTGERHGAAGAYEERMLSSTRRVIGQRLAQSKELAPHFRLVVDVRMDALTSLRDSTLAARGVKVSVNDLLIKAAAHALLAVPEVNIHVQPDRVRYFKDAHIAVAVALDNGLMTPVVHSANQKGILQIAADMQALTAKAREGRLAAEDVEGGTFSISNLGMFGIRQFDAIINPPQGAILAVGAMQRQRVYDADGGEITANVLTATLACDHRAIDGALGARFMQAFRGFVEAPATMLM